MRILICGDVDGRSGRTAALEQIQKLKKQLDLDFVVANVDNAAHGFGITAEMAEQFFEAGADVLTGGNHLFDQKDASTLLTKEKRLLRPANINRSIAGHGTIESTTSKGKKVLTIHLLGQKNMPFIGDNPFVFMQTLLMNYKLGVNIDAIVVDFHAEVTSEKNALGHFLDGKVSVIAGTHTHIPTADERILAGGTAFQTDIGMCGDYNSVIGMQKQTVIEKFVKGYTNERFSTATGNATFSALFVETDDKTGLAVSVHAIRIGGDLKESKI